MGRPRKDAETEEPVVDPGRYEEPREAQADDYRDAGQQHVDEAAEAEDAG